MRAKRRFACAGLLALLFASASLHAQFQQPTKEELAMTSDPKAPGAAAVFLNIDESENDPLHLRIYYVRIKVLSEKGKELATVTLPYSHAGWKVSDIKARTIHPDGTIIPLTGKPEDLLVVKKGEHEVERKVFNLPQVEVGSILEYRYAIDYLGYSSPDWEVQRNYFVHKAHFSFVPFENFTPKAANMRSNRYLIDGKGRAINSLIWWKHLPVGTDLVQEPTGRFVLDVNDVPARPSEPWMPPIQSLLYRVFFYYNPAMSVQDFWVDSGKDWSKHIDRFAVPSVELQTVVAGLMATGDNDLDKAKKLYKAVAALDNTDYSRRRGETEMKVLGLKENKHAEDVWRQKSGTSEEIVMLYLALARTAGLKVYAETVVNRNRGIFDPSYMSMSQFNELMVRLEIGDKKYLLDPGEKMCPFGEISWKHANARGLTQSPSGPTIGVTAPESYKDNSTTRTGVLNLDAQGQLHGALQWTLRGQEALQWRQNALRNDPDELKKRFDRMIAQEVPKGIEVHVDHFLGLDDPEVNLLAMVKVSGQVGTVTSKRMFLPEHFFEIRGRRVFADVEQRTTPVEMQYGEQVVDQITYSLPEGFSVEAAPADANLQWPNHAVYITKSVSAPGKVTVARRLARAFDQAKPEEYKDLRDFYQKVATADQQQIVLTTAAPAAAKGN